MSETTPIRFWSKSLNHRWLSAMTVDPVTDTNGVVWPSVEHYFQAAKPAGAAERAWIMASPTPFEAKKRAWRMTPRADWREISVDIMRQAIQLRYAPGREVSEKLLETADRELIHETPWGRNGDTFWGAGRDGSGRNMFGHLLMERRAELLVLARKAEILSARMAGGDDRPRC